MDGNNRQRMGAFVDFPEHDLSRVPQRQVLPMEQPRGLVSMGQLMDGGGMPSRGGMPMPAMMPQEQLPQQQDYGDGGQPQGKKILGMPKDRFIALMGTIAQAFGGDSASGRMGAGLVNMANMMREERMGQGKARAETTKEKRESAAKKRERLEKKKGKAPTVRTFRVGDMDVQHTYDYDTGEWKPIPGMKGKKVKEAEGKEKPPTIRTFRVGDRDVQHAWEPDTGEWKPVPGMPGKKVKPPAEEKKMTPDKAREKLFNIAKFKSSLAKTGGWNETIFELMAQKDPEFAKRALSISSSKKEVNTTVKELENYYKSFLPGHQKKVTEDEEFDIEKQDAMDAIKQGILTEDVQRMYKLRTGKELEL